MRKTAHRGEHLRPRLSLVERKLATALFVDLVDSTALVSGSDPEIVRRRVTGFFERAAGHIAAYGGTVEKFAGDAVVAVFGVPTAHEDDAERAVRAATAILESGDGGLAVRIGIESGEVVAESGDSTFATGEALNVAARLQQSAAPGEILMGPTAHGLTLGAVVVEPGGARVLKGLPDDMPVWRVICADGKAGRPLSVAAPYVGREEELELLQNAYARVVRDRRAQLVTIFGEPGIGKSRLAREFFAGLERTTVLAGRSLPFGEGLVYRPLAEMVQAAAGISEDDSPEEAIEKLREACSSDAIADLLGLASGVLDTVSGDRRGQEISWAAHEWATSLAEAQPLVLGFEDVHWAEEPLLDLIEHLADRIDDAPVLLVCLARPELLDSRPGWGGGRRRAITIELGPLPDHETGMLVDALVKDLPLPDDLRTALLDKTEGNPLFVEETVRLLVDEGDTAGVRIPDTLQALIAARIDRLPPGSKSVLRHGAVVGRVFWRGAICELDPELDVDSALADLVDRQLLTREPLSTVTGEQAYRFRHVLIRDVAYRGLTKSERARLHRVFASWLRVHSPEELVETHAYHLDRAAALLAELDGRVPDDLRAEASAALERAGQRALAREANRTARRLLLRTLELEPTLERRFEAARAAWRLWELPAAADEMEQVRGLAHEAGEPTIEGLALTALAEIALNRNADVSQARRLGQQANELLSDAPGDARAEVLTLLSGVGWWEGDLESVERYTNEALEIREGRADLESLALVELAGAHLARLDLAQAERVLARGVGPRRDERQPLRPGVERAHRRLDPAPQGSVRGRRDLVPHGVRALRRDRRGSGCRPRAAARGRRDLARRRPRARRDARPRDRARALVAAGAREDRRGAADACRDRARPGTRRGSRALGALGRRVRGDAGHDVALEREHGARARACGAGTGRGGRAPPSRGHRPPCRDRPAELGARAPRGARRLPPEAGPRRRGLRPGRADRGAASAREGRADHLSRALVRGLRDDRRGPLEPGERLA